MDIKKILMPNGKMMTFYKSDDQTWSEIIENVALPMWMDYCNSNWISSNHEAIYAPEKRVKSFLERCAWLILQDDTGGGIESEYKAMSHKVREIPASECPPEVADMLYSERTAPLENEDEYARYQSLLDKLDENDKRPKSKKKSKRMETRFDRLAKLKGGEKAAELRWCVVDRDNNFTYCGSTYHIPDGVSGYYVDDKNEVLGSMDRILVADYGDRVEYFDQSVYPIAI